MTPDVPNWNRILDKANFQTFTYPAIWALIVRALCLNVYFVVTIIFPLIYFSVPLGVYFDAKPESIPDLGVIETLPHNIMYPALGFLLLIGIVTCFPQIKSFLYTYHAAMLITNDPSLSAKDARRNVQDFFTKEKLNVFLTESRNWTLKKSLDFMGRIVPTRDVTEFAPIFILIENQSIPDSMAKSYALVCKLNESYGQMRLPRKMLYGPITNLVTSLIALGMFALFVISATGLIPFWIGLIILLMIFAITGSIMSMVQGSSAMSLYRILQTM